MSPSREPRHGKVSDDLAADTNHACLPVGRDTRHGINGVDHASHCLS